MYNFQKRKIQDKVSKNRTKVEQSRVKDILSTQLPEHKVLPLDGKYFIPQYEHLKQAIKQTKVDKIKWIRNIFDCENHALYFYSLLALDYQINTCGIVISYRSKHAFNIVLAKENNQTKVFKFEPQTDEMWRPQDPEKEEYITKNQIILI